MFVCNYVFIYISHWNPSFQRCFCLVSIAVLTEEQLLVKFICKAFLFSNKTIQNLSDDLNFQDVMLKNLLHTNPNLNVLQA